VVKGFSSNPFLRDLDAQEAAFADPNHVRLEARSKLELRMGLGKRLPIQLNSPLPQEATHFVSGSHQARIPQRSKEANRPLSAKLWGRFGS
jgi:hypothetical protein